MPNKKNIILTYTLIATLLVVFGVGLVVKAGVTMFAERDYWTKISDRLVIDSIPVVPTRGNIISSDGQLMASSVPAYRIYIDFQAGGLDKKMLRDSLNVLCKGLSRIMPQWSSSRFKAHLQKGMQKKSRYYPIFDRRISYLQFKQVKQLPILRLGPNKGGFVHELYNQREKLFGSLAARTLGNVYADFTMGGKSGIEYAYNDVLTGEPGIMHRKRVRGTWLGFEDVAPTNGYDVVTTLDVGFQDICEKILIDKLVEIDAEEGVVVLMDVESGDIKAMVNMNRMSKGQYQETHNAAISNLYEPGSTFKTAALMVALEDGVITPASGVDVGNGLHQMYGRTMRDHNANRGGYQEFLSVKEILKKSSNVGTSVLIDNAYRDRPSRFTDGLIRMGLTTPIDLKIGATKPRIRQPNDKYWSKTSLPWLSIGYESSIPPLQLLAFYNAIANDGKMVKPRLVKAIANGGETVETFDSEVLVSKICSDKTLKIIRSMLAAVVNEKGGLGSQAKSNQFTVAGKTGTAQISQGRAGYHGGQRSHLVSFCGFYPAEKPKYSCIVSIRVSGVTPSGGAMAGSTFGKIAERVMARTLVRDLREAVDSTSVVIPDVKAGELQYAKAILKALDVKTRASYKQNHQAEYMWGDAEKQTHAVVLQQTEIPEDRVPDATGMGAKDAVYLLESRGLKVKLTGTGTVRQQSIPYGQAYTNGQTIVLQLN